ncbi:glucans biosynthesis glucosyltransferase MdoH [Uliginosibacterium paludis]|uniref:Glucans biosynthesis glucosyltransferase H n=1 Tax=Uliginosibacterium paludis TaxID=1615952 RepID=A0ABV2CQR9_9RHOO
MERHPSPATLKQTAALADPGDTPPLTRGSMPASPWQGVTPVWQAWRAGRLRLRDFLREPDADSMPEPWQIAATERRTLLLRLMFATTLVTGLAMLWMLDWSGMPFFSALQFVLFVPLVSWISAGFWSALAGFRVMLRGDAHVLSARSVAHTALATDTRSAVVMPICNEHVQTVIAGLRATAESLSATGKGNQFDFFILSDTRDPLAQAEERRAWLELRANLAANGGPRVFYRVRKRPGKKKAGNVADFCRRWGRLYRYMIVLDADSIMSGDCLTGLVRLMEAHPRAGIIQTVPRPCGQSTLHARAQQFSARVTGSLFTAGMQYWQLGDSHYWGHNAIIRTEPFMRHCGLARLPGSGPLSGEILSHDFVEAALMRRAGYSCWVVPDLEGSFEQTPHNLLAELQRDQRWCLGNILNLRLIAEPGLTAAHRAMLATGAMAYASAPLWLCYLLAGTVAWSNVAPENAASTSSLHWLWLITAAMLLLPRVLGVLAIGLRGQQAAFGGLPRLVASALIETLLSVMQAPIRMFAHTTFVFSALTGLKREWKSPPREASALSWRESAHGFMDYSVLAALWCMCAELSHPAAALWLAPVYGPLLCSIPFAVMSGHLQLGKRMRAAQLLLVPEESASPAVLRAARQWLSHRTVPQRGLRLPRGMAAEAR